MNGRSEFGKICCNFWFWGLGFGRKEPQQQLHEGSRLGKMDEPNNGKNDNSSDIAVSKAVSDYVAGLSNEHRMLVILKAQLYDGTWEPMLDDLRNRLAGKPYIFKLVNRINDDIERIEQMQKFEAEHNIDLADYVTM